VVDPERGVVIGYSILYYGDSPRRMQINEIFKILDGRIRMVDKIGLMEEGITTSGFTHLLVLSARRTTTTDLLGDMHWKFGQAVQDGSFSPPLP
jgi:hypothetical protein